MVIKTVHITNYYHKNSGGISTSYNALMEAALRHKREMSLIVPGETNAVEKVNSFAKIFYVAARQSPIFDKRYRIMTPLDYMPANSIIRRILIDEKPDLIEITDKYTLSMFGAMVRRGKFKELGRPVLVHFSCERMDDNISSFVSGGSFARKLAKNLVGNFLLPSFDFHIANSPYTAEEFSVSLEDKSGLRKRSWWGNFTWRFFRAPRIRIDERIYVAPRGVDKEQFSPDRKSKAERERLFSMAGIPNDSKMLLYAGRISPEKNIELLPQFMAKLNKDKSKDYRLLIAGAGPKQQWIQDEFERVAPGKLVLLGHQDKETLANLYANADIFVHPNPREPYGIAPLEAMASGIPVVVPNSGGLLFYATDSNSWLVAPNADEYARAIQEIFANPELCAKKIKNALETAAQNTRQHSTDYLFETYDKIYADFIKRNLKFTDSNKSKKADFSVYTTYQPMKN